MHKSAFKYHDGLAETINTLQYFTSLKHAKSLANPERSEPSRRKSLAKSEETQGLCDIFWVQRPLSAARE